MKGIECNNCVDACSTGAKAEYGIIDASKCLSCLTIKFKGELPEDLDLGNRIYGCDTCQKVCPHNSKVQPTKTEEFVPSSKFLSLTKESIATMSEDEFREILCKISVRRDKLANLKRNREKMDTKT